MKFSLKHFVSVWCLWLLQRHFGVEFQSLRRVEGMNSAQGFHEVINDLWQRFVLFRPLTIFTPHLVFRPGWFLCSATTSSLSFSSLFVCFCPPDLLLTFNLWPLATLPLCPGSVLTRPNGRRPNLVLSTLLPREWRPLVSLRPSSMCQLSFLFIPPSLLYAVLMPSIQIFFPSLSFYSDHVFIQVILRFPSFFQIQEQKI